MKRRSLVAAGIFYFFFTILIARLYYLQIIKHEDFLNKVKKTHKITLKLESKRGIIYDRFRRELVLNTPCISIYARPKRIEEKDKVATHLASILKKDPAWIEEKLKSPRPFVWLVRKAEYGLMKDINSLQDKGIGWVEENKRFYPEGALASHILGFTGVDNRGLEGMELKYDSILRGEEGYWVTTRDARGELIPTLGEKFLPPKNGLSLVLTLDKIIQYIVEKEVEKGYRETEAVGVTAIVMDPSTGGILAMANRPTFDPNNFQNYPTSTFKNRAISEIYEPGSTFKIITAAAALEEKVFSPEDKIFCENGTFRLAGHTIHDVHPYGLLTFAETVQFSSNIGLTKVGIKLGEKKLYRYISSFGFGRKTGIDLPGEEAGILRPLSQWSKISLGAIPYGQEIGVTPLQLICAISAVANGGLLMKPYLVKEIINEKGRVIRRIKPQPVRQVISPNTAQILARIMERVVERGTGLNAAIKGYKIAGKTGTAQKFIRGEGYSPTKFVASFVGFAPADNPRVAVLVVVDEPQGSHYGGTVAAPIFRRIVRQTFEYLEIKPQKGIRLASLEEEGNGSY